MKKYFLGLAVLGGVFALFFGPVGVLHAAETPYSKLAPNTLFERFLNDAEKITSGSYEVYSALSVFKNLEANTPESSSYSYIKGVDNGVTNGKFDEGSAKVIEGDSEVGVTEMDIITLGDKIFIRFPQASDKKIKNKWIEVPFDKYHKFGKALNQEMLFESALPEVLTEKEDKVFQLITTLAKKHNLFAFWPEYAQYEEEKIVVKNSTRYDLSLNHNAVTPFFKELIKTIKAESLESENFPLAIFELAITNQYYMDYMADYSSISMWVDNQTSLPTRIVIKIQTPNPSGKEALSLLNIDAIFTQNNKAFTIKAPTKSLTFEQGLDLFGIDKKGLVVEKTEEEQALDEALYELSIARSKQDKSDTSYYVAMAYDDLYKYEDAAKYYKLSASYAKKNSGDYYEALAQAEWSLGNGAKAKEYFNLALAKAPKTDFVLTNYGWFLLGLNKESANFQDLALSLKLHEQLVSQLVDDDNLQSLYLSYLMLGDTVKAEETKKRFDNFATKNNYATLGLAYHRLGNKKESDKYFKMAEDLGYKKDKTDIEFLKMVFK